MVIRELKPKPQNPKIKEYGKAVEKGLQTTRFVIHDKSKGWIVKSINTKKATVFRTQEEAIQHGKTTAKKDGGELVVFSKKGTIRERNSYDKAISPSKFKA